MMFAVFLAYAPTINNMWEGFLSSLDLFMTWQRRTFSSYGLVKRTKHLNLWSSISVETQCFFFLIFQNQLMSNVMLRWLYWSSQPRTCYCLRKPAFAGSWKDAPAHKKELASITHALRIWKYYLMGTEFIIQIDHQNSSLLSHSTKDFRATFVMG